MGCKYLLGLGEQIGHFLVDSLVILIITSPGEVGVIQRINNVFVFSVISTRYNLFYFSIRHCQYFLAINIQKVTIFCCKLEAFYIKAHTI